MPKTVNIAVIGAGTMAQAVHLPVLRRRWDRFTITALVDHSPRRRRESSEVWGIEEERRYETVSGLIAAIRAKTVVVDAAVLSTDGLHVDDLLQLMRRGIPVLVEPPLGYSAEEIAKVADFERMTGRRLLMMAYPQQYDDSVSKMAEQIARKDLRMVDHQVLMPASQPLFGGAHVTTSSYDLPSEKRAERRTALQAAVVAGSGEGATQRDRDLYVKGLLTGMSHQLAVIEAVYGAVVRLVAVRHWPKGVIPGSLELLGELEGGAQVRLVWHYLPFAPEYSETIQVLSARRRMDVELHAPSHGDRRSTLSLREKKAGIVQETSSSAGKGSAEAMWEAFHAFVDKGTQPISGAAEARTQVELLREVLSTIVIADGRSLEPEPADDTTDDTTDDAAEGDPEDAGAAAADGAESADSEADSAAGADAPATAGEPRMLVTAPGAGGDAAEAAADGAREPAPATLEQDSIPEQDGTLEQDEALDRDRASAGDASAAPAASADAAAPAVPAEPAPITQEQKPVPSSPSADQTPGDPVSSTPDPSAAAVEPPLAAEPVADAWSVGDGPVAEGEEPTPRHEDEPGGPAQR